MFVKHRFELDPLTIDYLQSRVPKFGYNGFGELVFYRTYSRTKPDNGQENWSDVITRVTQGTYSIRKDYYLKNQIPWNEAEWQAHAFGFAKDMFDMKWLPPGRGLWAMGSDFVYERGAMALYNCFSGETPFITKEFGVKTLLELNDCEVTVLTAFNTWRKASVKSFGKQKLNKVVFRPCQVGNNHHFGRTNHRLTYYVTPDHRWLLDCGPTKLLQIGHKVVSESNLSFELDETSETYHEGYAHGVVFGDGTHNFGNSYMIRLCDSNHVEQAQKISRSSYFQSSSFPPSYDGDRVCYLNTEVKLKELPETSNLEYLRGFIDGWIEADSWDKSSGSLCLDSQNHAAKDWVLNFSKVLGYQVTGICYDSRDTNFGKRKAPLCRISLTKEQLTYVVESITPQEGLHDVYCVVEKETKSFTLAGGLPTGNCAFTELRSGADFADDIGWLMDTLMHGVGVGFAPVRDNLTLKLPGESFQYVIPDTREGWVDAVKARLLAYIEGRKYPIFIFDLIRKAGEPIKGFGGVASGPEPLQTLLEEITFWCKKFMTGTVDVVEFKTNIANLVGCCVVAGNVRRSAEIACGSIHDSVFMNLKDYKKNPHREAFGWMSNNSVILDTVEDFDCLGEIARRVITNGEPGVINRKNMKHGRIGKATTVFDHAIGFNPCGEIPLEHREVCNLSETLPTMCSSPDDWYRACECATFYSSTVSLLPTHQPSTNRVVARNRRIGVGIIDFSGWKHANGVHQVTKWLRNGYDVVTEANRQLNAEAGVPEALRKTCVKPGGTTPKLGGKTPGCGQPTFHYTLRRIRVAQNSPIHQVLVAANIPYEKDFYSTNTDVFEYPILQGPAKQAQDVSLWEQAMNVVLLQREWADNAVSNTLYFRPMWKLVETVDEDFYHAMRKHVGSDVATSLMEKGGTYIVPGVVKVEFNKSYNMLKFYEFDHSHEEDSIEPVLSSIIPHCKSISLLPHTPVGVYKQMVEEGISKQEYEDRLSRILPIDWSQFTGSDGLDEKYCQGDNCEISYSGNAD